MEREIYVEDVIKISPCHKNARFYVRDVLVVKKVIHVEAIDKTEISCLSLTRKNKRFSFCGDTTSFILIEEKDINKEVKLSLEEMQTQE